MQEHLEIKTALGDMLKMIVDEPEEVTISVNATSSSGIMEVLVSKKDVGKVIGRKGRTANALRTMVNCMSAKLGVKTHLNIIDLGDTNEQVADQ